MFRSQFRRHAIQRVNAALRPQRRFSSEPPYKTYFPRTTLPPVRVLGPTLWCFGVGGIIYVGCAAYEVYGERRVTKGRRSNGQDTPPTIKAINLPSYGGNTSGPLGDLTSAEKALAAIAALNIGIHGANRLVPTTSPIFVHIPYATYFPLLSFLKLYY